jgi:pimeloyl-ACP methyl ester carboxylesterase
MADLTPLEIATLPRGIRTRFARDINGLDRHVLEAGHETRGRPLVLLLHGFPELAYSWRRVMLPLAAEGFRVVAPGAGHWVQREQPAKVSELLIEFLQRQ